MNQVIATQLTTMSSYRVVAKRLGVCVNTVRGWVGEGELTAVRFGIRSVRIRDSEVEEFINRRLGGPSTPSSSDQ